MTEKAVIDHVRQIVLEEARKSHNGEPGTVEKPRGSNNVKYNTAFYCGRERPCREVSGDNFRWCVVFLWWCMRRAGIDESIFPKFASVFKASKGKNVRAFFKARNRFLPAMAEPKPGDLVIFKFSHIGFVESVSAAAIKTVEGNVNSKVVRLEHARTSPKIDGYCRPEYHKVEEEDDFMALFKNVNEFKAAVRAVVKDEVKDEVDRIYKALARGEIDGQVVATSTHFQDSNRGLSRHIHDEVDRIYRALARGEVDGQVVATSTHFQDSNRHLANLLEDIAARLPTSTPNP
jgi:hypothetical protein